MKTKIILLTTMLVLTTLSLSASRIGKKNDSLSALIEKSVGYPSFNLNKKIEGYVNLKIEKDKNNHLVITRICGSDSELVNYVEKQVNSLLKTHDTFEDITDSKVIRIKFNIVE